MPNRDETTQDLKPDLDSPERIGRFVRLFYDRLLADERLRPLFLEVAGVDLDAHLPLIAAYWRKMLLGEPGYDRHTMARHRALHGERGLTDEDARRWLEHFRATLDEHYAGPYADKARRIATNVMKNLFRQLERLPGGGEGYDGTGS